MLCVAQLPRIGSSSCTLTDWGDWAPAGGCSTTRSKATVGAHGGLYSLQSQTRAAACVRNSRAAVCCLPARHLGLGHRCRGGQHGRGHVLRGRGDAGRDRRRGTWRAMALSCLRSASSPQHGELLGDVRWRQADTCWRLQHNRIRGDTAGAHGGLYSLQHRRAAAARCSTVGRQLESVFAAISGWAIGAEVGSTGVGMYCVGTATPDVITATWNVAAGGALCLRLARRRCAARGTARRRAVVGSRRGRGRWWTRWGGAASVAERDAGQLPRQLPCQLPCQLPPTAAQARGASARWHDSFSAIARTRPRCCRWCDSTLPLPASPAPAGAFERVSPSAGGRRRRRSSSRVQAHRQRALCAPCAESAHTMPGALPRPTASLATLLQAARAARLMAAAPASPVARPERAVQAPTHAAMTPAPAPTPPHPSADLAELLHFAQSARRGTPQRRSNRVTPLPPDLAATASSHGHDSPPAYDDPSLSSFRS